MTKLLADATRHFDSKWAAIQAEISVAANGHETIKHNMSQANGSKP
jgi:hypothetical protein